MSQALAFANGWNLATTLMVCVVVFHADAGNFGVMPAGEYDGDPAAVAGYAATHGIAQMAMPSPTWQTIFAVVGGLAVSVTAFVRFTGMTAPGPAGQGLARG
jgi:hypothetical protein